MNPEDNPRDFDIHNECGLAYWNLEQEMIALKKTHESAIAEAVNVATLLIVDQMNKFKHDADFWMDQHDKERSFRQEAVEKAVKAAAKRCAKIAVATIIAMKDRRINEGRRPFFTEDETCIELDRAIRAQGAPMDERLGAEEICPGCGCSVLVSLHICPKPPKESQKIPALDKPADGLARVVRREEVSEVWIGDLFVTDLKGARPEPDMSFYCAKALVNKINEAHASIVKPLREKAERREDIEKKSAEHFAHLREGMEDVQKDADRLAEALKLSLELIYELRGYCKDSWDWKYKGAWDEEESKIKEALAAHEALKGEKLKGGV